MRLLPSYLARFSLFREEGEQASLLVGKQVGGERRGGLHRRVRLDEAKREGGGSRLDQNKLLTSSGSWTGAVRQLASRWGRIHRQEKSGLIEVGSQSDPGSFRSSPAAPVGQPLASPAPRTVGLARTVFGLAVINLYLFNIIPGVVSEQNVESWVRVSGLGRSG